MAQLIEGLERKDDGAIEIHATDVEEEFRSCCEDEEWQETEESLSECSCVDDVDDSSSSDEDNDDSDEFSLRMSFKGVSVSENGGLGTKASGIGIVMETSTGVSVLNVQKKLDFFVDNLVADHLALLDGLLEAEKNGYQRIIAVTDNVEVYHQIAEAEPHEDQLLVALGYRILELADKFETFVLKLVCRSQLQMPLRLAREAIGVMEGLIEKCLICYCEEIQQSDILKLKCSHSFCSECMIMYVEGKLQALQVPLKCPNARCKYHISNNELKPFVSPTCYQLLEKANFRRIYCPFPNCSVLLSSAEYLTSRPSSSSQSGSSCIECHECHRLVCTTCDVPWHTSMSCEEYQSLPEDERNDGDASLLHLAQSNNWRRCEQCRRVIELTQGCYHVTCWCGHEFCYSCGADYHDGAQSCQCVFWDDRNSDGDDNSEASALSNREIEQWRWETFDPLPAVDDGGYSEQERAQLALIQRFLAGGFSLNDDSGYLAQRQSPPRCSDSYLDAIKDLHQLPWLERFVSVISDSYHEDYIQ